jgi:hypothetical protein
MPVAGLSNSTFRYRIPAQAPLVIGLENHPGMISGTVIPATAVLALQKAAIRGPQAGPERIAGSEAAIDMRFVRLPNYLYYYATPATEEVQLFRKS